MISRKVKDTLQRLCAQFPVAGITGSLQNGETTLATSVFPDQKYITFDDRSFRNSAGYIQGWLFALKNDKRFIISTAGEAVKAVQMIPEQIMI